MTDNAQTLQSGTILCSPEREYKVIKVLGRGGFGITYLVEGIVKAGNISIKAKFAVKEHFISTLCEREGDTVKVLGSNATTVQNSLQAFIKEARRLQDLGIEHPNIVKVNEVFNANGTAYYVMEYLEGETLDAYVRRVGTLSEEGASSLIKPIIQAVSSLHDNALAHYDIKPQNIVLHKSTDDGAICPTLIDFGLAKHYDKEGNATSTNNVAGFSEGYSPSEQYAGIKQFSPWCDVYSLAATMLFCLTGRHPLAANDIDLKDVEREISPKLSSQICTSLLKALNFRRQDRQQSAGELYEDCYGVIVVECDDEIVSPLVDNLYTEQVVDEYDDRSKSDYIYDGVNIVDEEDNEKAKPWGKIIGFVVGLVAVIIIVVIFIIPKSNELVVDDEEHIQVETEIVEPEVMSHVKGPQVVPSQQKNEKSKVDNKPKQESSKSTESLLTENVVQEQERKPETNVKQEVTTDSPASGYISGHEWVDLGLSVKWATCNIGSSTPSAYGSYIAWGETSAKTNYSKENNQTYDKKVGNISGKSRYDAARASWGGSWRMPTRSECEELLKNCNWTWSQQDGCNGYKVASKKNGNSIFLPAAGYRHMSFSNDVGNIGGYWTSTPGESNAGIAYVIDFNATSRNMYYTYRYYGQSVRPVTE